MDEEQFLVAVNVVLLDGKRHEPAGPAFPAAASIAAELLTLEAVRPARDDEIDPGKLPPMAALRVRAIAGAVSMKLGDDDWTQAGTPKVAALAALVGFTPTAEEAARFKRS